MATEYAEFVFRADFLCNKQAQAEKDRLIQASYTAWQLLRSKGYDKNWDAYLVILGLSDKKKVDEEEVKEALSIAKEIEQELKKKNGR